MARLELARRHERRQLLAELLAAFPQLAPTTGPDGQPEATFTFSHDGEQIVLDLPDAVDPAAVEALLLAHVPAPPPDPIDYGADAPEPDLEQARQVVGQLRAFLALDAPTAAQVVGALKLTIRVLLWMLRQRFG
jgi:hypothetical protein